MSQGDVSSFFGGSGFDPNSVEPASDFEVLPAGKYPAVVEAASVKPTKAGNGHYMEVQFVIVDGPGKGRKLWDRLNIDNPNPTAVEIAKRALSALCKATIGDVQFVNTDQLLQKACVLVVKVDKSGDNAIRTYAPYADAASIQAAGRGIRPPQQASSAQLPAPQAPQAPCGAQQQQYLASGAPDPFQQQAPPIQPAPPVQQQPVQQQPVQQQPVQQQAPPWAK